MSPARPPDSPAPASRDAPATPAWLPLAAITGLVAIMGVDVFRIGFFADDFHFLDIARRVPLLNAITGQFGIYPWYRPLSRELYFAVCVMADRYALVVSHGLSLACVVISAWQVRRIGISVASPRVGAIAAVLFLAYGFTKFLASWASGFQDLLALLLMLLAVRAHLEDRPVRAIVWTFLAPFAKETALLIFPILALLALVIPRERGIPRRLVGYVLVLGAVTAIHLGVRATWHTAGTESHVARSMPALFEALVRVAAGFVGGAPVLTPVAITLAVMAGAVAAGFLVSAAPAGDTARDETETLGMGTMRTVAFLSGAAALGIAPLIAGHGSGLVSARAYYGFPAAPWLAMLLAIALVRLPRAAGTIAISALVAWNTATLGYRAPDLSSPDAWRFKDWDWAEAVRLTAVSKRLAEGLHSNVVPRPESLVVLYSNLPAGSFFQTEDGPATRESLRDPSVRAYWVNAPPYGLRPEALAILSFNPESRHLEPLRLTTDERDRCTATALAVGNGPAAWAFASQGETLGNESFEFAYYRAAAALLVKDMDGARREFGALGLLESTGAAAIAWADRVAGRASPLYDRMVSMLSHPMDPVAHLAFADAFHSSGLGLYEAVELRIATTLDPTLVAERLRLGHVLVDLGQTAVVRAEYERLAVAASGTPAEAEARRLLMRISRTEDRRAPESPIGDFGPRQPPASR